jgi:hypothetical protein
LPTSSDSDGTARPEGTAIRFEALVGPDGRIEALTERRADGGQDTVEPTSRHAVAVLTRGECVEYRFDDGRRLRNLPYLDLLLALRQEVLLTAHKARHGELVDEPEALPFLRALLARIEATATAFRRTSAGAP